MCFVVEFIFSLSVEYLIFFHFLPPYPTPCQLAWQLLLGQTGRKGIVGGVREHDSGNNETDWPGTIQKPSTDVY